jgi:hypothetical protein
MDLNRAKQSATLTPLWRASASDQRVRCVTSTSDLTLVAVGTTHGVVIITRGAVACWSRFVDVSGVACTLSSQHNEGTVFVRDTNGLWEVKLEVAALGPWRCLSTTLLYPSTKGAMQDGLSQQGTIGTHGGVSLQERSLLLADPQFMALRVVTNTDGAKNFLQGLVWLRMAGGLHKSDCTLSEARGRMEDAQQSFAWHVANVAERAEVLKCSPVGLWR